MVRCRRNLHCVRQNDSREAEEESKDGESQPIRFLCKIAFWPEYPNISTLHLFAHFNYTCSDVKDILFGHPWREVHRKFTIFLDWLSNDVITPKNSPKVSIEFLIKYTTVDVFLMPQYPRNMSEESDSGDKKQIKELTKIKAKPFLESKTQELRCPSIFPRTIEESENFDQRAKETLKPPPRVYCSTVGLDDGRKFSEPRKTSEEKSEKSARERQRRPSAFESVLHVLRRPSIATMDMFSNFRRGSAASKGSHVITDSRRSSHLEQPHGSSSKSETSLLLQKCPQRRPSVNQNQIIIRRPSGAITFNPDQMNVHQKRYILGLLQGSNNSLPELCRDISDNSPKKKSKQKPCSDGNDSYISAMSALYANLLCVLGIAFPVTEVLSPHVHTHFYQAYYLYLYMGSLAFMTFMYFTLLKDRAVFKIIQSSLDVEEDEVHRMRIKRKSQQIILSPVRYGSFYLRLGAVAFGVGSMVYSGLEFGQYFELKQDSSCHNLVQAATPVTRMILTLVQMQFIFLSSRQQMEMSKYRGISKFGLMHMIATNLCEWLNVIVEETKHEIIHLRHLENNSLEEGEKLGLGKRDADVHDIFECRRANVMGSLVQDASPFLFPCTIEYSLICAVILYEMWKDIKTVPHFEDEEASRSKVLHRDTSTGSDIQKSNHLFSVDCSNAHKGLFSGILVLVMTIISLIMFFVMTKDPNYRQLAVYEVNVCELVLYCITIVTVVAGGWQMRYFKYKLNNRLRGIGLDNTLLMWAQSGTYIYCMFSIIACYFMISHDAPGGFITEMCSLIQTTFQTAFILDATFRRTDTLEQHKRKPGRQIVTFLLVANMTLWLLNTLQKNRAEFRPTHLQFYGVWAWTIITHVSMPLAIFYRFHSTICLFEIWKDVYKFKQEQQLV